MRIDWYIGTEDDQKHLCMTEGELPREGSTVYFRDEKMASSKGTVVHSYHSVGRGNLRIEHIEFPPDMSDFMQRLEFAAEHIRRTVGGTMGNIDAKTGTIAYATQRGEVIVKLEEKAT